MTAQSKKITAVAQKIRVLYEREHAEKRGWHRSLLWLTRWALMLYHEFLRDDVKVRAESLAFLMIFSLLPLIAGAFFVFTIFAQFGFVQDALQGTVEKFLVTIPLEHRGFVQEYVLKFKDSYLQSMTSKSGSIGIFALFILMWVGLQTFNNVDRMLNHIWSSDRNRPFIEQVRNFLVVAVAAPLVLVSGLSVPLILQKLSATRSLFEAFPIVAVLLNSIVTPGLILVTFLALYRYVPVRRVRWRPALAGALFATVCFELANWAMQLYFAFGTNSAYGKAAIVPLIGLWIYVVWIIIILGAEVGFLLQNQRDILFASSFDPTLREGAALLSLLSTLYAAHRAGRNPVAFDKLRAASGIATSRVHLILDYLHQKKILVECVTPQQSSEGAYALAFDPGAIELREMLQDFFKGARDVSASGLEQAWKENLTTWFDAFGDATVQSELGGSKKPAKRER